MAIARIDLTGTINARMGRQLDEILSYAERARRIKAVMIVINSGGGDAAASEIIASAVKRIRRSKPVFAVIEGVGASGAYWVASAASRIYAMSTSIVGSIGVIGITPNVKDLLDKIGVRMNVMKVGQYKDMLSPFTEGDEEGRSKYMKILENSYDVFRGAVSENRNISGDDLNKITTGEIFSSKDSLSLGLIDKIGTFDDAVGDISRTYGISPKLRVIAPRRSFLERFLTSSSVTAILYRLFDI